MRLHFQIILNFILELCLFLVRSSVEKSIYACRINNVSPLKPHRCQHYHYYRLCCFVPKFTCVLYAKARISQYQLRAIQLRIELYTHNVDAEG